ncbi:hypothetical protein SARC_08569 [Sphaeroforma arctica JP610]|uniref:Uncharacterized protein n=1 Tax=Sphaeroforma arctica JP610 TaxID=667725 RepID=A0A0L0FST7_9EUKA|nr:hypothetical protein SARC_08569 [Sphaeroforma arctica JP610]KNC79028.1 hypothetical protein SARC_08569 [Sphaeroforma arctica JP610]|eukprot:XP_014152930.1 hypothetical protein SARC_08569 [Sphaeroforma arctica JP610]
MPKFTSTCTSVLQYKTHKDSLDSENKLMYDAMTNHKLLLPTDSEQVLQINSMNSSHSGKYPESCIGGGRVLEVKHFNVCKVPDEQMDRQAKLAWSFTEQEAARFALEPVKSNNKRPKRRRTFPQCILGL